MRAVKAFHPFQQAGPPDSCLKHPLLFSHPTGTQQEVSRVKAQCVTRIRVQKETDQDQGSECEKGQGPLPLFSLFFSAHNLNLNECFPYPLAVWSNSWNILSTLPKDL
jgi:hypothetical protein